MNLSAGASTTQSDRSIPSRVSRVRRCQSATKITQAGDVSTGWTGLVAICVLRPGTGRNPRIRREVCVPRDGECATVAHSARRRGTPPPVKVHAGTPRQCGKRWNSGVEFRDEPGPPAWIRSQQAVQSASTGSLSGRDEQRRVGPRPGDELREEREAADDHRGGHSDKREEARGAPPDPRSRPGSGEPRLIEWRP